MKPRRADDESWMLGALNLARRALGRVAPNPAVGCLLVTDGRVVARGWTQSGGRPHAESEALSRAGDAARGATCYVTLEPCAHQGTTPPCADALIEAGVVRCVVAVRDPDERVNGRGLERLRQAGMEVTEGVCSAEAERLNAGYLLHRRQGRPLVTLKLATSLDGRIATSRGESQWITGEPSRARAHLIRARHDAIMVGSGTATADNPSLTVRLPGLGAATPARVVLDGRLRLPLTHKLVATAEQTSTYLVTRRDSPKDRMQAYENAGVHLIPLAPDPDGRPPLDAVLGALAQRGITRLLVEGGSELAGALLRNNLVDRLIWFRAGRIIGGDGLAALPAIGVVELEATPRFRLVSSVVSGQDTMETYDRDSQV